MFGHWLRAAPLALAVLLSACAPATLQGLREKPAGTTTFEVNQGYQQVYRTVVTNARRCWQTGLVTAQMVVQGDLYTDIKTAEVTVALHGGVGVDTHLGVDIKAIDETHTQVKTYHALSSWSKVSAAVEKWVREPGFTECRA